MWDFLYMPRYAFEWAHTHYGFVGVMFLGLMLFLLVGSICVWLERRR